MDFDCRSTDMGVCIIALKGRTSLQDLKEMEARLKSLVHNQRAVIIDLSHLDFLFSMCLRTLIICAQWVQLRNGRLVIFSPNENILAVLKASGVMKLLPVCSDMAEAEAAVLSNSST